MQLVLHVILSLAALLAADGSHAAEPVSHDLTGLLKSWADRYPMILSLIEAKTAVLPFSLQQVTAAHFSQSPTLMAIEAVKAASFDAFIDHLMSSLELGGDKRMGFRESMSFIKNAETSDWSLVNIVFDRKDGAGCKYAGILVRRNVEQGTYDFKVADFKSSFQLGSDILLIEVRKSHLWSHAQPGEIRAQRIPADLRQQDVELLLTSLSQAALARFAELLGISVPGGGNGAFGPNINRSNYMSNAATSIVPESISAFKTASSGQDIRSFAQNPDVKFFKDVARDAVTNILIPNLLMAGVDRKVTEALEHCPYAVDLVWHDIRIDFSPERARVQYLEAFCMESRDNKINVILVKFEFDSRPQGRNESN